MMNWTLTLVAILHLHTILTSGVYGQAAPTETPSNTAGHRYPPSPCRFPGRDGRDGMVGPQGTPGFPGFPGHKGEKGIHGFHGLHGSHGPRGPVGAHGSVGRDGLPGPVGVQGLRGLPGTSGEAGLTGSPGAHGSDGNSGPDGVPGLRGLPGTSGEAGVRGSPGFPGLRGPGRYGDRGAPGIQGPKGSQGLDGRRGPPGERNTQRGGVSYTRWGKSSCRTGSSLVYVGRTGTSFHSHGSGSNYICMPKAPEYTLPFRAGVQGYSYMYGVEYEGPPLVSNRDHHNAPCAVCYVSDKDTSLMIPARSSCPTGWMEEYNGYLMSELITNRGTEFVCVDKAMDSITGSENPINSGHFYHVEAHCGGMACPPYDENKELNCVVCTK